LVDFKALYDLLLLTSLPHKHFESPHLFFLSTLPSLFLPILTEFVHHFLVPEFPRSEVRILRVLLSPHKLLFEHLSLMMPSHDILSPMSSVTSLPHSVLDHLHQTNASPLIMMFSHAMSPNSLEFVMHPSSDSHEHPSSGATVSTFPPPEPSHTMVTPSASTMMAPTTSAMVSSHPPVSAMMSPSASAMVSAMMSPHVSAMMSPHVSAMMSPPSVPFL